MTGIRPKRDLLEPGLALPLLPAIARQAAARLAAAVRPTAAEFRPPVSGEGGRNSSGGVV